MNAILSTRNPGPRNGNLDRHRRRATPPSPSPAALCRQEWRLGFDGVSAFPVSLDRGDGQPELLAQGAGKEPADRVWLPAGYLHQFFGRGAARSFQQFHHLGSLAAIPGSVGLFAAAQRVLLSVGLLGRISLRGRSVRALSGNGGLLVGSRLLGPSRLGDVGFFNSLCDHVVSFGGDSRDHMNHSVRTHKQVNSNSNQMGEDLEMAKD